MCTAKLGTLKENSSALWCQSDAKVTTLNRIIDVEIQIETLIAHIVVITWWKSIVSASMQGVMLNIYCLW